MTLWSPRLETPILALAIAAIASGTLGPARASSQERAPAGPAVRAWTDEIRIPTYPLGPEDPNPHFREIEGAVVYPYTMQDRFTTERVDRTYRAVYLENEYLRVLCLPEIGGRIQSVWDKVAGREMLYRNQVIRPGHIALRGAWVSGGIEWNRGPQGHTVTSFAPVDVRMTANPDGSASLLIGGIEQIYRTGWEVRLTLHPGRRLLDEQIRLFNPTDGLHPYYFWNNVAFPETPATRFIFPMRLGTDHAGTRFFDWPVHDGRDLTWVRNYPEPTSVFGYRVEADFFGAYDVDRDYGIVQVADHHLLPGKKAWTWGQSDAGKAAQSVLTDEDGPYIEVQSGPLRTQADFAMLLPGQEISWQEVWYPVNGLGDGFEHATRHAAVQRLERGNGVELRFVATASVPDARLEIHRADGRVQRQGLELAPGRVERVFVAAAGALEPAPMKLRIRLRSAGGESLLDTMSPPELPEPARPQPAQDGGSPGTPGDRFRTGWRADLEGDRAAARAHYLAALELDPGHADSLRSLAALELEAGRAGAARDLLARALARAPEDGLAHVLLAGAALRSDDLDGAEDAGFAAVRQAGTTALGWSMIGRARARRGDYDGAIEAFTSGLAAGGGDWTRLFEGILLATYGAGDAAGAAAMARRTTAAGTLRPIPHLLPALDDEEALTRAAEDARRWLGDPGFAFVEASLAFDALGLTRAAADVLDAGAVRGLADSERRPVPLYYLAWYRHRTGNDAEAARWLDVAGAIAVDGAFPSRPETLPVLEWVVRERPADARAHEALGNLYAGLGRLDEAVASWRRAAELEPRLSVARRNLAMHAWRIEGDLESAERWLREALAARPQDQTLARDLGRLLLEQQRVGEATDLLAAVTPAGAEPLAAGCYDSCLVTPPPDRSNAR